MHLRYIFQESLQSAIKTISVNKLRTILSLLGVTIGIFSIITVLTVLDSLESNIRDDLSSLGDDVINIDKFPWAPENGEEYEWWKYIQRPIPTLREYIEIKKRLNKASAVSFIAGSQQRIQYRKNSADNTVIWGVSEGIEVTRKFDLEEGRFYTDFEFRSGKNYAIIGNTIARRLFADVNPLNKSFKIGDNKVQVIGVFKKEGKSIVGGGSLDEVIWLPINYFRTFVNIRDESTNPSIWVKAAKGVSANELKEDIRGAMRAIRRLKPSADDNFALNQTSMLNAGLSQIFSVINLAGWIIGLFSVLVGGFGIANIMFVSVRERTAIIGIQKALGAKRQYILLEVLYESGILSVIGGIIGLILIFLGTMLVNSSMDFKIYLTFGNIITGILIAASVGVVAGIAPAMNASRLNPVQAISSTF